MASSRLQPVLRHLRKLACVGDGDQFTDGQLLERFLAQRDEDAFASLVHRHGRLVLRVCQNVLHHEQDAQDAFQATYLILARKANSLRRVGSLAGWLYRVAYRSALEMRRKALRRRNREQQARPMPQEKPDSNASWRELQTLLDEEVQRLPAKYQAPLILCCLQGKSKAEAARELGWKEGTVSGRLAEARQRLQQRLTRRGVSLSAVLCAAWLSTEAARAALPAGLLQATVQAALCLAARKAASAALSPEVASVMQKVIRAMFLTKVKIATALLMAMGLIATGSAELARRTLASEQLVAEQAVVDTLAKVPTDSKTADERQVRADAYGDPLPPGALGRLGTVRFRHGSQLSALAFSPDGKIIASGGLQSPIRLWDANSGKPCGTLVGPKACVFSLMFSADGKRLVSAGSESTNHLEGGKLVLWDFAAKKPVWTVDHDQWVRAAAFSPDGQTVAMSCDDGALLLLDAATGKEGHSLGKAGRFGSGVAFSSDGKLVAAAGSDECIQLWDSATGKEHAKFPVGSAPRTVTFSPDGNTIASAHGSPNLWEDGSIILWDTASGKRLHTLLGQKGEAFSVSFSPDGKRMVSGGMEAMTLLWDVQTGKLLRTMDPLVGWVQAVAFAPDGRRLAAGATDGRIMVWDAVTGEKCFAFDRQAAGPYGGMALAADGKTVAMSSVDNTVGVWDLATVRQTVALQEHKTGVYSVDFAPDGKRFVTGGADGSIRVWDSATGKEQRRLLEPGTGWHSRAVYSPSGQLLASAQVQDIRLWDPVTYKEIRQIKGHDGYVMSIAFSPDEKLLASASHAYVGNKANQEDFSVRVWDVASGSERHRYGLPYPNQVAFRPDGRLVACLSEDRLRCWDTFTGKEKLVVRGKDLTAYAFSPDGRWLATSHRDGTVRVQEPATGQEILRFGSPPVTASKLIWAADAKTLIAGNGDLTVLVWDLTPSDWDRFRWRQEPTQAQLDGAWEILKSQDAIGAYRAIWQLTGCGDAAVALLQKHLRPGKATERGDRIRQLIADLDDEQFTKRDAAFRQLAKLGNAAEFALVQTLNGRPSAEVRSRVKLLLNQLKEHDSLPTAEQLREERALAVLERIGSAKAREVIETLAAADTDSQLGMDARAALRRLANRSMGQH